MPLRIQPQLQLKFNQQSAKDSRRERTEIFAQILLLCDNQKRKTTIRYKTNLCYRELMKDLDYLTQLDMLECDNGYYVTTKKENEFIEVFANLQKILYDGNKNRSCIWNLE